VAQTSFRDDFTSSSVNLLTFQPVSHASTGSFHYLFETFERSASCKETAKQVSNTEHLKAVRLWTGIYAPSMPGVKPGTGIVVVPLKITDDICEHWGWKAT